MDFFRGATLSLRKHVPRGRSREVQKQNWIIWNVFPDENLRKSIVVKNRDDTDTRRDTHPLGSVTLTHPAPLPPSSATVATFATPRSVEAHVYKGPVRLQPWCGSNATASHSSRHHWISRDRIRGSADIFACDAMATRGSGTSSRHPRETRARTCACVIRNEARQ